MRDEGSGGRRLCALDDAGSRIALPLHPGYGRFWGLCFTMMLVHFVAMLAVLQYLVFGALVGRARGLYGVKAPAVTGHERFERAYRIHMNTLELLVALLPAMYVAACYWPPAWAAGAGVVYLVGRVLYWRSYSKDPDSRALGFLLSIAPLGVLLFGSIGAMLLGRTPGG